MLYVIIMQFSRAKFFFNPKIHPKYTFSASKIATKSPKINYSGLIWLFYSKFYVKNNLFFQKVT